MVFVSTGGYSHVAANDVALELMDAGIKNIELSGGKYVEALCDDLIGICKQVVLQVHNYFPPPEYPFVFNLASSNDEVRKKSFDHALRAIKLSQQIDRPIYSFHAGYLLDPDPSELGTRIGKKSLVEREEGLKIFLESLWRLADIADKEGVQLLIENNVTSYNNFNVFKCDPFLMSTPEECVYVMKNTPDCINLLLDVAHLKVSANTLGFDPIYLLKSCDKWIRGYHLSDNDGKSDSNQPFDENAWFWPYLKKSLDYYSIEVYGVSVRDIKKLVDLTNEKLVANSIIER